MPVGAEADVDTIGDPEIGDGYRDPGCHDPSTQEASTMRTRTSRDHALRRASYRHWELSPISVDNSVR